MSRVFPFLFLLCFCAGCASMASPETGEQVAAIAAAGDSVLAAYGIPAVVGDLSSAVMAAMAAMYGWKKLKSSPEGKLLG